MALQSSGAISLNDIATEFGGTTPINISDYYRGGSRVPNITLNNAVPMAGALSLSNFYGATNRVTINISIGQQNNYILNTAKAGASYIAGASNIIATVTGNISATHTNVFAFDIDTSWNSNDNITLTINAGCGIYGCGGAGGAGGSYVPYTNAVSGAQGGPALRVQRTITLFNYGVIAGGGGGGGGGKRGSFYNFDGKTGYYTNFAGGGGGGGRSGNTNSSGGAAGGGSGVAYEAVAGNPGTIGARGTGSRGAWNGLTLYGGSGGDGGGWGAAGGAGGDPLGGAALDDVVTTSGGSAGYGIVGYGNMIIAYGGNWFGVIA